MKTLMRCDLPYAAMLIVMAGGFATEMPAIAGAVVADQVGSAQVFSPADQVKPRQITLEQRGDICVARKNFDDAVDFYYRALRQASFKNAELWNKMGIAFQQESKLRNAHKCYLRATHVDKNFAEAWNNIGTIYSLEKRYAKSLNYFQRAIRLKADVAAFHINLGSTFYHLKKYPEAVTEYRTALLIDPRAVSPGSSVGRVIHTGATDVEYYYYMAKALASVGNVEVAVRYLRRALEDGFTDRQRIEEDPDFQKISHDPAFVELMRNPPVAIKE